MHSLGFVKNSETRLLHLHLEVIIVFSDFAAHHASSSSSVCIESPVGIFFRCCFRDYEIAVRLSRSAIVATGSIFLSNGIKESANESIAFVLLTVWVISPFSQ